MLGTGHACRDALPKDRLSDPLPEVELIRTCTTSRFIQKIRACEVDMLPAHRASCRGSRQLSCPIARRRRLLLRPAGGCGHRFWER